MRCEWKEYQLSDVAEFVSEKIKSTDVSCSNYISTNNMVDNFGGVTVADGLPSTPNFNAFKSTDTLFSNIRTYFKKVWFAEFSGGCSPDVLVIRTKNEKILDPGFLYLILTQEEFTEYTVRTSKGAKMPRGDKSAIMQYKVKIPSLDIQIKLKNLILSFNKKIALNTKTNKTIEQLAQALFKSWFIDFDPVKAKAHLKSKLETEGGDWDAGLTEIAEELGLSKDILELFPDELEESELGDIPKGWCISNINEVCEFQNGYAFKSNEMTKTPEGAYKVFKMGGIKKGGGLNKSGVKDYFDKSKCKKLDRYLIKKGDLLMCMTDMKNNVALLGHTALMDISDEFILNQRVGLLRTKNKAKANYPFLYILTNYHDFIQDLRSRANSGVQVNLSTSEIKNSKFVLPTQEVHLAFDKIANKLQEKIFSIEAQNCCLPDLRDTLLPKLLSGEITIEFATDLVKSAA